MSQEEKQIWKSPWLMTAIAVLTAIVFGFGLQRLGTILSPRTASLFRQIWMCYIVGMVAYVGLLFFEQKGGKQSLSKRTGVPKFLQTVGLVAFGYGIVLAILCLFQR